MKIAIIDMDSVMFTIANPNKKLDENGIPIKENNKFVYYDKTEEELFESCDYMMNYILTKSNSTHYIAYIKGKETTFCRKIINPNYKSTRPSQSPKWWKPVKDYLIQNWKIKEVDYMEVDDAVNITRLQLKDSFICAIDKDLLHLEGKHYNWKTNTWTEVTIEEAEYYFWSDMIIGQPGDDIKGIPGKGEKFVEKLFNQDLIIYPSDYTTAFEFTYRGWVLDEYVKYFGEEKGIEEFYKNYKSLKILDKKEGFIIPEIIEFKTKDEFKKLL